MELSSYAYDDVMLFMRRRDWHSVKEGLQNLDVVKKTILHWLCYYRAPVEIVEFVLKRKPELSLMKDSDNMGKIPLHWACFYRSPLDIIQLLLTHNPDSALLIDKCGNTPLHYTIQFNKNEDEIQLFADMIPNSILLSDNNGRNILHHCMERTSFTNIVTLLKACPSALQQSDRFGVTPMDNFFAKWHTSVSTTVDVLKIDGAAKAQIIQELYEKATFILSIYQEMTNETTLSMLHSAIVNPSCPWLFCEVFVALLPDELELLGVFVFVLVTSSVKKHTHFMNINPSQDEVDKLNMLYTCLMINPSLCAIYS